MLRRRVAGWEAAAGLPAELAEDLELALGEAAANAAEHAYPAGEDGEFEYTVERCADGDIAVSVRDHGAGVRCRRTTAIAATGSG